MSELHEQMAATMSTVGTTVPIMPTPRPWMTTVAGPVLPDLVMFCVGRRVYDVVYSVNQPMRMPATRPMAMHEKILPAMSLSSKSAKQQPHEAPRPRTPARRMAWSIECRSLVSTSLFFSRFSSIEAPSRSGRTALVLTKNMPTIEQSMPVPATQKGRAIADAVISSEPANWVVASAHVAMIEPTNDSKRSAPMPATSPTLSPTLSAMTAALLGWSSGMPASTLPTRSAPTSAALV